MAWRCNCPICRIFVHPVIKRVKGLSEPRSKELSREGVQQAPRENREREDYPKKEVAEQMASVPQIASVPATIPSEEIIEDAVGRVVENVRSVIEENSRVIIERFDRVEENIGKLRKELQSLVNSIEDVVIEFREAISNLTNPLMPRMNGEGTTLNETRSVEASCVSGQFKPLLGSNFIRTIISIINKAGVSTVIDIIDEYKNAGLISEREAAQLKIIVNVVNKLKSKGIDEKSLISLINSLLYKLNIDKLRQEG